MIVTLDSLGVTIENNKDVRYVNYDKFIKSVADNTNDVKNIELLPYGTLCMTRVCGNIHIAMQYPACIKSVIVSDPYGPPRMVTIPIPNTILVATFNKMSWLKCDSAQYSLINSHMFATLKPVTSYDARLYFCPLGNIYPEGNICWGSAPAPSEVESFDIMSKLYNCFYDSIFNDDIDVSVADASFKSCSKLFKFINGKEEFPDELMQRTEHTLQSFMQKR